MARKQQVKFICDACGRTALLEGRLEDEDLLPCNWERQRCYYSEILEASPGLDNRGVLYAVYDYCSTCGSDIGHVIADLRFRKRTGQLPANPSPFLK